MSPRPFPLVWITFLLAGCTLRPADALYVELGGESGITGIVDSFLVELAGDERIVHHFAKSNIEDFRRLLIEQFCDLAGGPCVYSGDSMSLSHRGMGISAAEFNALVENLIEAMESQNTPLAAQNRLLRLLTPMHGEIMAVQDADPL